jgi:hypothetical protein
LNPPTSKWPKGDRLIATPVAQKRRNERGKQKPPT